jgi:4-amino-4-deoxy-L-arabinose transferase-like glycosyltransferase
MLAQQGFRPRRETIFLFLFLAAAAALRFHDLSTLPPAHYRDVALTAMDALRAAAGHPRIHYTYDEGLYANLMGIGFLIFGVSDGSVRAPGALFGALTCWGVYRLGKALGEPRAGLYGAGLLAVSFWHVLLSRSGFRAVLLPLLLALSMALLVEGPGRSRPWRVLLGGALFGLGVHVYPSIRFAPLFVLAYLLAAWRADPAGRRRTLGMAAGFAGAAFVVALPLLLDYLHHPEHFSYPHRILWIFSPGLRAGLAGEYFRDNVLKTLLMFHVRGDENWRHNLPGAPLLDPLTGALLILGLIALFRPPRPGPARALLVSWIVALALPNLLSVDGVPHGLRTSGALPALALVAGIGLATLEDLLARRAARRLAAAVPLAALLIMGGWTACRYFVVWGGDPRVAQEHDGAFRAAARVLLAAPSGVERFLLANGTGYPAYGHPAEVHAYLFEMRDAPPVVLGRQDAARIVLQGRPALLALVRRDERAIQVIQELNPGAPIRPVDGPGLSPESPVYRIN